MSNQITVSMLNVGAANVKPFEFGVGLPADLVRDMSLIAKSIWKGEGEYKELLSMIRKTVPQKTIQNIPCKYKKEEDEYVKEITVILPVNDDRLTFQSNLFDMCDKKKDIISGGRYCSSKEKNIGKHTVFGSGSAKSVMDRMNIIAGKMKSIKGSDEEIIKNIVEKIDYYLGLGEGSSVGVFIKKCADACSTEEHEGHVTLSDGSKADSNLAQSYYTEGIFVYAIYTLFILYKYIQSKGLLTSEESDTPFNMFGNSDEASQVDISEQKKSMVRQLFEINDVLLLNETGDSIFKPSENNLQASDGSENSLSQIVIGEKNTMIQTEANINNGSIKSAGNVGKATVSEAAYAILRHKTSNSLIHFFTVHMGSEAKDKEQQKKAVLNVINKVKELAGDDKFILGIDTNSSNLKASDIKEELTVRPDIFYGQENFGKNMTNYTTSKIRTYMQSQLGKAGIPITRKTEKIRHDRPELNRLYKNSIEQNNVSSNDTPQEKDIEAIDISTKDVFVTNLKVDKFDILTYDDKEARKHGGQNIRAEKTFVPVDFFQDNTIPTEQYPFDHFIVRIVIDLDSEIQDFGFKGNTNGFTVNENGSISVGGGKRRKTKRKTKSNKSKVMKKKSSRKSRVKKGKKSNQMNNAMMNNAMTNNKSHKKRSKGKKHSRRH